MKIAFYTVFMGTNKNWSCIIPKRPPIEFDSYYYTNNIDQYEKSKKEGWNSIFINIQPKDSNIESAMDAKIFKACPHFFEQLKNYEYTCYLDTKIVITDYQKIINVIQNCSENKLYLIPRHPFDYHNVWDEYNLCIKYEKYRLEKDKYSTYIKKNLENGFQEYIPFHFTTQFMIRKNSELTNKINELWYQHILECGIECQISFSFIQQLFKDHIEPLDNKFCYYNI